MDVLYILLTCHSLVQTKSFNGLTINIDRVFIYHCSFSVQPQNNGNLIFSILFSIINMVKKSSICISVLTYFGPPNTWTHVVLPWSNGWHVPPQRVAVPGAWFYSSAHPAYELQCWWCESGLSRSGSHRFRMDWISLVPACSIPPKDHRWMFGVH